ncbi:hypothetical protein [Actinokineospora sp. NBRC 105648]|uniref:hypothetical protein n=1 Tax=Actinokineospora sp. NBRC 105648 TaxID=3032206 RepID=UPI0024A3055C|nr:hypothetical protein [Actinokineospora sp. NBRC 105648]GLZ38592.1 hypothetical protein Acsp05_22160 [Actinokineospora sp. NBRC 105648]
MRTWHRPLLLFTALMAATALVSAVGLLVDDRVLVGSPIWLKPLKFSLSFVAFGLSWAWLLSLAPRTRLINATATTVVLASVAEMAIIVGQVVRGRRSHFNQTTELDGMLFSIMGATIVVLWVGTLLLTIKIAAQRLGTRSEQLAIRWGMLISLVGLLLGGLMLGNSSGVENVIGAHSVGVPDGGPGLPLVNWSTTGGDLRVPHFIGMHALQLLPLVALAVRRRPEPAAVRVIWTLALGYSALVALVTWQALRGQSIIHPDWATGTAFGVIAVGVAIGLVTAREKVTA